MKKHSFCSLVFAVYVLCLPVFSRGAQPVDRFESGRRFYLQSSFDRAVDEFTIAIKEDPKAARLYLYRAIAYYNKTEFQKALSDLDIACSLKKDYALAFYNRAVVYYSLQDYSHSWQDVHKAAELGFKPDPVFFEQLKEDSGRQQ
jgi:tetratricopeptide (TPR) repeat protein